MTALRSIFVPTAQRADGEGEQGRVSAISREATGMAVLVLVLVLVACIALRAYLFVPLS